MHNVVAVVSWWYKRLLAREREEREGAASGMDTALKKRSLELRFYSSPWVDNGSALPMHNVVAVVSWWFKPLLAREREEREGAASGMDTALKKRSLGLRFVFITVSITTTGAIRPPFCFCRYCLLAA